MLTNERAETLTNFLTSDPERAQRLLEADVDVALQEINDAGYDFTTDELNEYCSAFKAAVTQGELNVEQLENVAGGVVVTGAMVAGLVGCFAGGAVIGVACGARW